MRPVYGNPGILTSRLSLGKVVRMRITAFLSFLAAAVAVACALGAPLVHAHEGGQGGNADEAVDLWCLCTSYPEIVGIEREVSGEWLLVGPGRVRVPYATGPVQPLAPEESGPCANADDIRNSMAQPYPLEPERPATPYGVGPGRVRSYAFLGVLYGTSPSAVRARLRRKVFSFGSVTLNGRAADAMERAGRKIEAALAADVSLRRWLKNDGDFVWRRIAEEERLSPHSYGIALDLSANRATYWQWNRQRPHPLQETYPRAIVEAFESEGFIWGGKWHKYDMMHFEYRPEILCKSRVRLHAREAGQRLREAICPRHGAAPAVVF
ncbi:MAG: M15 family metallopeptidase [Desulfovibrio sp.]|nr:M15 family metallopeptidase [Desulfovibrio sp.]